MSQILKSSLKNTFDCCPTTFQKLSEIPLVEHQCAAHSGTGVVAAARLEPRSISQVYKVASALLEIPPA